MTKHMLWRLTTVAAVTVNLAGALYCISAGASHRLLGVVAYGAGAMWIWTWRATVEIPRLRDEP